MDQASLLIFPCLWFIQGGEQKNEKCHIIGQGKLPKPSMVFVELPAQPTVKTFIPDKFPYFEFRFICRHIAKHGSLLSGLLYKFKMALRTGDGDLPFSLRYPDGLMALWAAEQFLHAIPLLDTEFNEFEIIFYRIPHVQKFLVFPLSLIYIP